MRAYSQMCHHELYVYYVYPFDIVIRAIFRCAVTNYRNIMYIHSISYCDSRLEPILRCAVTNYMYIMYIHCISHRDFRLEPIFRRVITNYMYVHLFIFQAIFIYSSIQWTHRLVFTNCILIYLIFESAPYSRTISSSIAFNCIQMYSRTISSSISYLNLRLQLHPDGLSQNTCTFIYSNSQTISIRGERWGAGVETQKNVRGEIGGWGRVPFNEPYAPLLSTIYDGA